jgi:hypothetical protein
VPSFFLALLAASLATLGGREAVRMARLSSGLGGGLPVLVAGWLASLLACLLAARLGAVIAAELPPEAKGLLIAIALLVAAAALLVLRPGRAPAEPTRSFGAVLLVLGAGHLTAATGLLVFALAGATGAPWLAAAGGALGSGAVFTAAWSLADEWEARMPLGLLRYAVAALLLAAALVAGLSAPDLL